MDALELTDPILDLIAETDAKLLAATRSEAMRSDPYRLALGVLVAVTQLLASIASRVQQPAAALPALADPEAMRIEIKAAAHRQGRLLVSAFNRQTALTLAGLFTLCFVLGAGVSGLAVYKLTSGHFEIDGALLCRAVGAVSDAKGQRFYPPMDVHR